MYHCQPLYLGAIGQLVIFKLRVRMSRLSKRKAKPATAAKKVTAKQRVAAHKATAAGKAEEVKAKADAKKKKKRWLVKLADVEAVKAAMEKVTCLHPKAVARKIANMK